MRIFMNMTVVFFLLFGVCGSLVTKAEAEGNYTAKVVSSSLNVRSEPSQQASIAGTLKLGDIVTVSVEENGWLQVSYKKINGWVAGYYTKRVDGSQTVTGDDKEVKSTDGKKNGTTKQANVLADSLRIRSGAGSDYKVVGSLVKSEQVTILSRRDGWVQIRTSSGQVGWVDERYIGKGTSTVKSQVKGLKGKVIVIDPGHGGNDPGMIGVKKKTLEKDLTLSTALYIRDELSRRGAKVILTRTKDDQKPSLEERVRISDAAHADAFVSVHYNSSEKKNTGTLTFYYSETKDRPLAHAINSQLGKGIGLRSNGVSYGDYHVLRENNTVSALVELGFLSNEKDEKIVRESSYQRKAAAAIVKGLEDYFN
ncbi:N-acetylmuramoyl-L-alanine amidase [Paenibacillus baekrokdamisoli]|uniref:N-acetylmuramoyl-L-alanine amidase n=1 Tax=Paenibacillus baekrokdamisoli TaxID=1712516 RepID=A0A3G9J1L2_9BACL|nr:N-acetylmuramoyl-L-alanine amidase [Paenibacillus baekrokdamisoli]MBB3070794.1 N-acetylmuramoyl-L-alanine amidase [Paenibacillus baekrokdamisoli]BBH22265.1 N-acetylmuramoyl-L-alanine amidase [Paenibacillus baekrokdamisoli]